MSIVIDLETCPIPMNQIPPENKAYLEEKSKNKRSGKIVDGETYGNGAIGRFELSSILCCCVKVDDKEIVAYTGDEKDIMKNAFNDMVGQDHVITFNGNSFDLPMLKMRGIINGIHTCMPFNIKSWDEHYRDVRFMLTDKFGVGDLSYWARVFSIPVPKWDDMDKSDLSKYPIERVIEGCKSDVEITYKLFNRLNNYLDKKK